MMPGALAAAAYAHPLLVPAVPRLAAVTLRYAGRAPKRSTIWLDERRAEEGAANFARKLGFKLVRWQWVEQTKAHGKQAAPAPSHTAPRPAAVDDLAMQNVAKLEAVLRAAASGNNQRPAA
jgi:hypothetical protein